MTEHFIRTDRLILRKWKDSDLEPFVRMNQDPIVMEYFPSCFSYEQSLQLMQKIRFKMERDGYGFFAVSLIGGADFIGMIGLMILRIPVIKKKSVKTIFLLMT